ncbi:hypothetical protein [Streptomyces sennicomposti]
MFLTLPRASTAGRGCSLVIRICSAAVTAGSRGLLHDLPPGIGVPQPWRMAEQRLPRRRTAIRVQIIGRAFREDLCLAAAQEGEDRLGVLTPISPRPESPAAAR